MMYVSHLFNLNSFSVYKIVNNRIRISIDQRKKECISKILNFYFIRYVTKILFIIMLISIFCLLANIEHHKSFL